MKSLQQKYEEAKARATKGLEEYVRKLPLTSPDLKRWADDTLQSAKTRLGIRKTDSGLDTLVSDVISSASARLKKATKKEKTDIKAEAATKQPHAQ
jgi:hypothetical protein